MNKAFVLGAGLGTRLKLLTDQLPKPLIPVFHRPLITYAFDHLMGEGIKEFIVNTHHLPQCYEEAFPDRTYKGAPLTFRHEPVLLETAGGIANIADLVPDDSFMVYNGDILTDLPLAPLIEAHQACRHLVTLVLRSTGPAQHIAFDPKSGRVTDIRNRLNTGKDGSHQFTGIYAVHPEFLKHLTPGKIESVIPIFLKLIEEGASIGGVVVDEGFWWDLGDRDSYLDAHATLLKNHPATVPVSLRATIDPGAHLKGLNVISEGAIVEEGATLEDCILWPGAHVRKDARLQRCIVRRGMTASGDLQNTDV
ncbi:NDP-sugar synthase [soil metagenome]